MPDQCWIPGRCWATIPDPEGGSMMRFSGWIWVLAILFGAGAVVAQEEKKDEKPAQNDEQRPSTDQGRQDRGRGPGGFRGRGGGFSPSGMIIGMALNDEVAKALQLNDEQKKYLELLRDQTRDEDREFFDSLDDKLSREERFEKFREYQAKRTPEFDKHIKEILGEEKLARLKQIRMQAFGAFALMSPDVAKEVEITDSQREQMGSAMREVFSSMRERFQNGNGFGDRDEMRKVFEEVRKEVDGKILGILTDRQKERWTKMVGEPVAGVDMDKIRESMRPRGGPGGPGGPGGERGPGGRGRGGNRPRGGETNQPRT